MYRQSNPHAEEIRQSSVDVVKFLDYSGFDCKTGSFAFYLFYFYIMLHIVLLLFVLCVIISTIFIVEIMGTLQVFHRKK